MSGGPCRQDLGAEHDGSSGRGGAGEPAEAATCAHGHLEGFGPSPGSLHPSGQAPGGLRETPQRGTLGGSAVCAWQPKQQEPHGQVQRMEAAEKRRADEVQRRVAQQAAGVIMVFFGAFRLVVSQPKYPGFYLRRWKPAL